MEEEAQAKKEKEGMTPAKAKKRKKGESVQDEDEEDFIIENEESESPAVKKGKTSKIVLSKPPKKKAKQTSNIEKTCYYCKEVVTSIDIKAKNVLVHCSSQKTH